MGSSRNEELPCEVNESRDAEVMVEEDQEEVRVINQKYGLSEQVDTFLNVVGVRRSECLNRDDDVTINIKTISLGAINSRLDGQKDLLDQILFFPNAKNRANINKTYAQVLADKSYLKIKEFIAVNNSSQ